MRAPKSASRRSERSSSSSSSSSTFFSLLTNTLLPLNKHTRLHTAATPCTSAAEARWDGLSGCRSPTPICARQAGHLAQRHSAASLEATHASNPTHHTPLLPLPPRKSASTAPDTTIWPANLALKPRPRDHCPAARWQWGCRTASSRAARRRASQRSLRPAQRSTLKGAVPAALPLYQFSK
eukprot:COSAG02_NODE_297_length_25355_cov_78.632998_15_plen_181_part_00